MQINKIACNPSYKGTSPIKKDNAQKNICAQNPANKSYSSENLKANYIPFASNNISFKGNASEIKNAYIITGEKHDVPLLATKKNGSYVVDFDSQTEIIYGDNAKKYLLKNDTFDYDTQIIIPKKCKGTLTVQDGKTIPLSENSALLINSGSKAKVRIKEGYPMLLMSKKDYDWYERYGKDAKSQSIKDKYEELVYFNSHLYNGEFSPNSFLSEDLVNDDFLKKLGINKWEEKNNLLWKLYEKRDKLQEDKKEEVEFTKKLVEKLFKNKIITIQENGYFKFKKFYKPNFEKAILTEKGFSDRELDILMPIFERTRQTKLDTKIAVKNKASSYSPEIIDKMKEKGFFHNAKKDDGYVYWKEVFGSDEVLYNTLANANFTTKEQKEIVSAWKKENKSGFDLSGLKFINDDLAVYNLDDKVNNWTHEKTNWVSNSTAMKSADGTSPFLGVSLVQHDKENPTHMDEIRKEEKLHSHPNLGERRQTEVYVITSGAAALNVVKDGKSRVQILKEGDLAVVGPGVMHCVNSVLGEYEHIVAQVPSAFQYGFDFKQISEPPEDYDEQMLKTQAKYELEYYKMKNRYGDASSRVLFIQALMDMYKNMRKQ